MHTVTQAAGLLKLSRARIHYLIKIGRMDATRVGSVLIVNSLRIKPGRNGRPPGNANGKPKP